MQRQRPGRPRRRRRCSSRTGQSAAPSRWRRAMPGSSAPHRAAAAPHCRRSTAPRSRDQTRGLPPPLPADRDSGSAASRNCARSARRGAKQTRSAGSPPRHRCRRDAFQPAFAHPCAGLSLLAPAAAMAHNPRLSRPTRGAPAGAACDRYRCLAMPGRSDHPSRDRTRAFRPATAGPRHPAHSVDCHAAQRCARERRVSIEPKAFARMLARKPAHFS